jgi:hypothetical protein
MTKNNKFYLGEEYIIDLPKDNGCCLSGKHHCIVIKRFGSTVQVVPISKDRDNIHYGELPIDVGEKSRQKKLKIKVGQLTTVSIEYIGRVNKEILKAIKDFIQLEIVNFIDSKVA